MTNSSRKIIRGVRLSGKTYATGSEDDLARLISPADADRLKGKGHLEGPWATDEPEPKESEPTKEPDLGDGLNDLTVAELKERARDAGVQGSSTMNKAALIDALSGAKEE